MSNNCAMEAVSRLHLALDALKLCGWEDGAVEDSALTTSFVEGSQFAFSAAVIQREGGGQFLSLVCAHVLQQSLSPQTISLIDRLSEAHDMKGRPIFWFKKDDGREGFSIEMRLVFEGVGMLEIIDTISKGQRYLSEIALPIVTFNNAVWEKEL